MISSSYNDYLNKDESVVNFFNVGRFEFLSDEQRGNTPTFLAQTGSKEKQRLH